jgi:hypothetical protein
MAAPGARAASPPPATARCAARAAAAGHLPHSRRRRPILPVSAPRVPPLLRALPCAGGRCRAPLTSLHASMTWNVTPHVALFPYYSPMLPTTGPGQVPAVPVLPLQAEAFCHFRGGCSYTGRACQEGQGRRQEGRLPGPEGPQGLREGQGRVQLVQGELRARHVPGRGEGGEAALGGLPGCSCSGLPGPGIADSGSQHAVPGCCF